MVNKKYILPLILVLAIIGIFIFSIFGWSNSGSESGSTFKSIETGTTEQGDVSIVLTPKLNGNKLEVEISANTHSVDLSGFNLKDVTTLEYDNKIIKPSSAPKLSGHHVSGMVVFDVSNVDDFTIKITGIPKINERVFSWS